MGASPSTHNCCRAFINSISNFKKFLLSIHFKICQPNSSSTHPSSKFQNILRTVASMDLHYTPFPGKVQSLKSRTAGKNVRAGKNNSKDPPISREKRVSGTSRSTNIPAKTETEKPATKPTSDTTQEQPKSSRAAAGEKSKLPDKNRARSKKKSVCFQEKVIAAGSPAKQRADGPRTRAARPKVSTPYHTAENCGKCRFDKLETAAYWVAQIRLSESAGKHFVSAAFFRLALDCKAEPIREIQNEVKRYLGRHECV